MKPSHQFQKWALVIIHGDKQVEEGQMLVMGFSVGQIYKLV